MSRRAAGATLRIGIDARDAYAPTPRGVGKALDDAMRELLASDRGARFHLYRDAGRGPDRYSGKPWVREAVLRMRGHRLSLWERVALPTRAAYDRLDLFHAPFPLPFVWLPVPLVVTIHDLIPMILGDGWPEASVEAYRRLCVRNAAMARLVVTVSETTKRDLIRCLGLPEAKIRVVYWAPRDEYYRTVPQEVERVRDAYGLPSAYFLVMGGASPRKNLPRILEAYAALPYETRRGCPLLIGGVPDSVRHDLESLARSRDAATSVQVRDYLPERDLPPLLAGARALLYLSLYEGFGLPVLEAMAAGTAVLASDRSAIPEVAGEAADYVNPEAPAAITAALRRLAEDERHRLDLVARGRDHARRFTWDRTAAGLVAVYRDAAG